MKSLVFPSRAVEKVPVLVLALTGLPLHTTPPQSLPLHTAPPHSPPLHITPPHSSPLHITPPQSPPLHTTRPQSPVTVPPKKTSNWCVTLGVDQVLNGGLSPMACVQLNTLVREVDFIIALAILFMRDRFCVCQSHCSCHSFAAFWKSFSPSSAPSY